MRDSLLVNIGYWVMALIVNIVICAFSMDERSREREREREGVLFAATSLCTFMTQIPKITKNIFDCWEIQN